MTLVRNALTLISLLLTLAVNVKNAAAQSKHTYAVPQPTIGWDSLNAKIPYDELLRRAGVEGAYTVTLRIDSVGNVVSESITPLNYDQRLSSSDSALVSRIKYGLKDVVWKPATIDGHPVSCTFRLPVVFYLTYANVVPPFVKHVEWQPITTITPGYFFR